MKSWGATGGVPGEIPKLACTPCPTGPPRSGSPRLDDHPAHFSQLAGLICWYDTSTHYYLRATHAEGRGRVLGLLVADDGDHQEPAGAQLAVEDWPALCPRARFDGAELRFAASPDGARWQQVGPVLDASRLSDDYGSRLRVTGAFVGLCAQDLGGTGQHADFGWFELRPVEEGTR